MIGDIFAWIFIIGVPLMLISAWSSDMSHIKNNSELKTYKRKRIKEQHEKLKNEGDPHIFGGRSNTPD